MQGYLENRGYFNSKVTADTVTDGYRMKAVYHVKLARTYSFGDVGWRLDSNRLSQDILTIPASESLLKKGQQYDAGKIKSETERISTWLKNKGYYYFKPEDILHVLCIHVKVD